MISITIQALFLLILPMFAVAPGLFMNRSSTPKMLLISIGLCLLFKDNDLRRRAAAHKEALIFLGACVLSMLFCPDRWTAFAGSPRAPYYGVFEIAVVVMVYLGSTEMEECDRNLALAGAAIGTFCLLQQFFGSSLVGMPVQGGRAAGFRGSPVMLGASLIPCLLAGWHIARTSWTDSPIKKWLPVILIFSGMIAAQSKGAIYASLFGIWIYETKQNRLLVTLLGVSLLWLYIVKIPAQNNLERLELMKIAFISFLQHHIFGWGPDNFLNAFLANKTAAYAKIIKHNTLAQASAHQDIAQVASTLGLVGLWAYLKGLLRMTRVGFSDPMPIALLGAMIIQAQVNPIPTDVLVVVAFILGSRQYESDGVVRIPTWIAPVLLGVAITLTIRDLVPG